MKKTLCTLAFCISFSSFLFGQKDTSQFKIGAGGGMGFFNPIDVNKYISDYISSYNGRMESGFSDVIMNVFGLVSASYTFKSNVEFRGTFECAVAPKVITATNGDGKNFAFWRFSPGISLNYKIPISDLITMKPQLGLFYHQMSFEGYSAGNIGERLQINFDYVSTDNFVFEFFVGMDLAKANTNSSSLKTLSYSGGIFGLAAFLNI